MVELKIFVVEEGAWVTDNSYFVATITGLSVTEVAIDFVGFSIVDYNQNHKISTVAKDLAIGSNQVEGFSIRYFTTGFDLLVKAEVSKQKIFGCQ